MTNKKQICTDGCDVCFMRMSLLMAVLFTISIYAHATPFQGLKKDSLFYSYDEKAVNGTTGTPLGGFGCGAVKFDANTGRFAVMTAPPADAYDFVRKKDALLQFYSKRDGHIEVRDTLKACLVNGRPADDAVWPLHFVDFGNINGVRVEMTGISPLDNRNYDNMHLPYALYEVVLTNTEDSDVTAAFAFKWSSKGQPFSILPGKGIYSDEWSLMAACGHPGSAISIGDDKAGMFLRQGFCDHSRMRASVQKVSVTTTLSAHETRRIHFVLAWYDRTDPEIGYYMNLYKAPKEIAEHGLSVFSLP